MIQAQLKLRLTSKQNLQLEGWLWNLTGVWNWAIKKLALDKIDGIRYTPFDFRNLLEGHSTKLGIPGHVLQGILSQAYSSWGRYFKKLSNIPRFKGSRNRLCGIPFPDPIKAPIGNFIKLPGLGKVRFHKQTLPLGAIKSGQVVKRASGWYLCLFIDTAREKIERRGFGRIGIDPGFLNLLATSDGRVVIHPRETEESEKRIAQAQRGGDKLLVARLKGRVANRIKDRNHKLSLKLVQENIFIAFSADTHAKLAKKHGRSVNSSSHYQLRRMLAYKSRSGGSEYVEVSPQFSTKTCHACSALTGPSGVAGLSVRHWRCIRCGAEHDRDTNAARNTLLAGAGMAHEVLCA